LRLLFVRIGACALTRRYEIFLHCFTAEVAMLCILGGSTTRAGTPERAGALKGTVLIAVARAFWELEQNFCHLFSMLAWAHVVWHLLSAWACYEGHIAVYRIRVSSGLERDMSVDGDANPYLLESQDADKLV
jgi:hypothetical protein